ncbi:ATP-grasp domain-containing protein [Methylovorus menthalis]|uniref:ATP-grasp domain-containing protein n=1 Tax=Methylovorus menthalis TaxID=1002227 RepID=UPI001E4586D8|nr:ATP-grasp domain-containing protein [Methylovorus menthalis]MCB4811604.1 ATP-grasp domain-containing protein [Methylovorus menthalis]
MAASARPYVAAASAAGYHVLAADVFGDEETRAASTALLVLPYCDGGFTEDAIRRTLIPALSVHQVQYLLYGSGFETRPSLLDLLSGHVQVLGNTAVTVSRCKSPQDFYASCLALDIPVPDTLFALDSLMDEAPDAWLCKRAGHAGGMHITPLSAGMPEPPADVYFQRKIAGHPVSLLFLAHEENVHIVGFQRQLVCPYGNLPYRYAGLVGPLMLASGIQDVLVQAASRLTRHYGLRGLNSLDAVMTEDAVFVLEINPRLSASLALYEHQALWLQTHVATCLGESQVNIPAGAPSGVGQVRANLVCYSPIDLEVPAGFAWPSWVVDRPAEGTRIDRHMPLCTIVATAGDDLKAEQQARQRAQALNALLNNIEQSGESHESSSFGCQSLA